MIRAALGFVPLFTPLAAGGAVWAAMDHDALLAWSGAAIAVAGAGVAIYHKVRAARREENLLDDAADLSAVARLSTRITAAEAALERLNDHIKKAGCKYPNPDGTAKCTDIVQPPHSDPRKP